jgi:dihydroorotase
VAAGIPENQAKEVVDVRGLYVTPGLIDLHVHVYAGTGQRDKYTGDRSVYPDGHTFRSGVTTVVDAGTSGWTNFPDFKQRVIDRARTRVLAMLNIVGKGMAGRDDIEQDVSDMDPQAAAKMAKQHPDIIVGIKTAHFAGPEWVAVDNAVEAGKLANLPVMVDFGDFRPERPFEELVTRHLRPGDIYTHAYRRKVPYTESNGRLRDFAREARQRGVKFDVGHGGGSFGWQVAVPAIREGFVPDSISTDLHIGSMNAGMKDMLNVMSKILNLGVPFADVIKMSTANPASQIKRTDIGHLTPGVGADVTVLRVDKGRYGFTDSYGGRFDGTEFIVGELTLRDGRVVWDLNGRAGEDWQTYYSKN